MKFYFKNEILFGRKEKPLILFKYYCLRSSAGICFRAISIYHVHGSLVEQFNTYHCISCWW